MNDGAPIERRFKTYATSVTAEEFVGKTLSEYLGETYDRAVRKRMKTSSLRLVYSTS